MGLIFLTGLSILGILRGQWLCISSACQTGMPFLGKGNCCFLLNACFVSQGRTVSFFFSIFIFMQCLSVFPPNLWLCQTASAKFKEGFYSFWICYLPPAIFICCHLILVSEETVNCHCLCTFSLCFFPPRTSVYKLQSAEKTECQRIVKIK